MHRVERYVVSGRNIRGEVKRPVLEQPIREARHEVRKRQVLVRQAGRALLKPGEALVDSSVAIEEPLDRGAARGRISAEMVIEAPILLEDDDCSGSVLKSRGCPTISA